MTEIENNQKQFAYERQCDLYEQRVINTFKNSGAVLSKDGDQWCVLLGNDLQVGVAGFGDTPYQSMIDFFKKLGCV